jgi:hypothetical protein
MESTTVKDNLLSGIAVLNQDQKQQTVPIDNTPTHVPHGIMNASTHIATQLITPSSSVPVVGKDYTVLTTQSCPPCHGDILSALELEIMTLMRTEGWSREMAVRILLAKSSSESHSKVTASDQQQNPNNRHILGMKAVFPSTNNASNYYHPVGNATSHQLIVSEHQQQGKERGKVQWRQYQNHPMRGSQQSNSHHHHHHAVEKASSSHTNRMFDHQPYIKEIQKAPTNHHSVVAQGQGQGQGQGHRRGIPRSHAGFAAAPDEGPDWGTVSSLSLSGSECEEWTEVG